MSHKSIGQTTDLGVEAFAIFSACSPSKLAWSFNQMLDFHFEREGDLILRASDKKHYCSKFSFFWDWFDTELRIISNPKSYPLLKSNIHIDYLFLILDGETSKAASHFETNQHFLQNVNGIKRLNPKYIRKLVAYL